MSQTVRWTSANLELLPDNGNRYEIIDGELFVLAHRIGNVRKLVLELVGL